MARISDGFINLQKHQKMGHGSPQLQQERFQAHSIDFKRRGHTYQNVWNSATLQIPNPWGTGVVLSS